jgi:hypothetical protein
MMIAIRRWAPALAAWSLTLWVSVPALAQDTSPLPAVSVGAGMRTSFSHTQFDEPEGVPDFDGTSDRLFLDSARIYFSGSASKTIKFMFNTEYNGASNDVEILDAAAQFVFSPGFNIWAGRFLPPSDRANLYGPYYAHHWNVFQDGVQDGYPFIFQGRANGVMYWGQYGIVKVSAGVFDGPSLDIGGAGGDLLTAGRVQVDLWDPEAGYYLNGTYYGDKNLLAIGFAAQAQGDGDPDNDDSHTAMSADFLLEKKVGMGGAFTVEAEWARYSRLGGYPSPAGPYETNDGAYVLGSYLFPAMSGPGRFEVLGKFAVARFITPTDLDEDEKQTTTEVNLNYLIRQFNARVMIFYQDTRFHVSDFANSWKVGVGLQVQM